MTGYPGIRASDEDRSRTAAALGEHYAAGRLTLDEFQERLDGVYAATTLGELDHLMADLPVTDLGRLPGARSSLPGGSPAASAAARSGTGAGPGGRVRPGGRAVWRFWLAISVVAFVIWLLSAASGGPWFLWVAVPLGLVMLRRWIEDGPRHDGRG